MTPQETITVLAVLREAYPSSMADAGPERATVWADLLAPYDGAEVLAVVRAWVRSGRRFPPNVGEIVALAGPEYPSAEEVLSLIECSHYGPGIDGTTSSGAIARRVSLMVGGPQTLANVDHAEALRLVRSALAECIGREQRQLVAALNPATTERALPRGVLRDLRGTPVVD
jgi:hypothetical protein